MGGQRGVISCVNLKHVKNVWLQKTAAEMEIINICRLCQFGLKKAIINPVEHSSVPSQPNQSLCPCSLSCRRIWPGEVHADQLALSHRPVLPRIPRSFPQDQKNCPGRDTHGGLLSTCLCLTHCSIVILSVSLDLCCHDNETLQFYCMKLKIKEVCFTLTLDYISIQPGCYGNSKAPIYCNSQDWGNIFQ